MAKETCVFCGEEVSTMRGDYIPCGPMSPWACKSCIREVKLLGETDRARLVLQRRFASQLAAFEEYVDMVDGAEEARPVCQSCGGDMTFKKKVTLEKKYDLLEPFFEIIPACCKSCGRMVLFDPGHIRHSKELFFLAAKDTGEIK